MYFNKYFFFWFFFDKNRQNVTKRFVLILYIQLDLLSCLERGIEKWIVMKLMQRL